MKSRNNSSTIEYERESDVDIDNKVKALQVKNKLYTFIFWFALLLCIVLFLFSFIILGIVVLIGCFAVAYFMTEVRSELKNLLVDNIIKDALEETFDNVYYNQNEHINRAHIKGKKMGIGGYDRVEGNDRVKALYKGMPIEMSDIKLIKIEISEDEECNKIELEKTVFRGLWMVCDLGRTLSADMCIRRRNTFDKIVGNGIKTENASFNRKFVVDSERNEETYNILTSHIIDYIVEADKKAGGKMHMYFAREGKLYVGVNSGKDYFEVGRLIMNIAQLRKKFVGQICFITDLMDELMLIDTLYK